MTSEPSATCRPASTNRRIVQELPADYFTRYETYLNAVTVNSLAEVSNRQIFPDSLIYVVVGDAAVIEAPLRGLEWAEFERVDE